MDEKIAVVYYSRTGHARRLAEKLAKELNADIFALSTQRYKSTLFGYMQAGFDSLRHRNPQLKLPLPELGGYDAVIVGGPIWTSYPAAPLRSFLAKPGPLPKVIGLFFSAGGTDPNVKAADIAKHLFGHKIAAWTCLPNDMEGKPEEAETINAFVKSIKRHLRPQLVD